MAERSFMQLERKVVELSEIIKGEHNVHQVIKNIMGVVRVFLTGGGNRRPKNATSDLPPNKTLWQEDEDSLGNQQEPKRKKETRTGLQERKKKICTSNANIGNPNEMEGEQKWWMDLGREQKEEEETKSAQR